MVSQDTRTEIRPPRWDDLPTLLALGRRLHAESWYAHIAYSENRVAVFFCDQILKRDGYFCRVAVRGGMIVGVVAGTKSQYWFSEQFGAFDRFLYVVPEFRGTTLAFRLWKEFRAWGQAIGAVELSNGVGTAIAEGRADKFFRGVGMTCVGGIYKLQL